jgi:hypothetical protein
LPRQEKSKGKHTPTLGNLSAAQLLDSQDIKKQNAALKAQTQSDVDFAKSAQGLYKDSDPERAGALAQSIEALNDPGLNAYEKAALASGLRQNISDGFKLQQMQSAMQMQRQRMSQMGGGGGGQVAPAAKFVPKF